MTTEITEHTIMKQIDDLQEQLEETQQKLTKADAVIGALGTENHQLRVANERYKGAEQAREEVIDKLIDKLGDR